MLNDKNIVDEIFGFSNARPQRAARRSLSIAPKLIIPWHLENISNYEPLHIGESGDRIANVTGVCFLTESWLLAAHHSGQQLGIFDITENAELVIARRTPCRMDDIACRSIAEKQFEIIVSGCWKADYLLYVLDIKDLDGKSVGEAVQNESMFTMIGACQMPNYIDNALLQDSFSHSVFYVEDRPSVCYHTGKNPRVDIDHGRLSLPFPGHLRPTAATWDSEHKHCIYIGVNHQNPKHTAFAGSSATILKYDIASRSYTKLFESSELHVDHLTISNRWLFMNNQFSNSVIAVSLEEPSMVVEIQCADLGFPHGIDIFKMKYIAIACYKPSSIVLLDLQEFWDLVKS